MLTLSTDRLSLRPINEGDESSLIAMFTEPEWEGKVLTAQRHVDYLKRYARAAAANTNEYQLHFAVTNELGEVVGFCNLSNASPRGRQGAIGFHFGAQHSGNGYATETVKALLQFAFEERGLLQIKADCFETNVAVIRVFEKVGMIPTRAISLFKWFFALSYFEFRPVVRYVAKRY